ncbi:MAG TPA: diacylglycerol kinase family protein [Solirubrobacteraceae bacterium]|nr:diacylglycerol kinase family protein [Solirubrobacteraceae bacterium]
MDRDVALLCNPSAGGGRAAKILPRAERALTELGVRFHTEVTRDLEHGRELARRAAIAGEVTVTLSGDGLVGCVVGVLREIAGSVLGILPGGRGNDTARMLAIPPAIDAACAVVARGVERDLDIGDVEGRSFIGIASLGFDSDANRIANEAPSQLGRLVYVYGAMRALAAWKHAAFELRLDGEPLSFTGYSVAACNSGRYGGGMQLAPDARLDDGLLDVVLIGAHSKRHFLRTMPKVFSGTHVEHPAVRVLRGRELHVGADRPLTVYADGDPIGDTPLTISVVPHALRVLVPGP